MENTKLVWVVMLPTKGNVTIANKEPKDSSQVPKGTKCYSFTGILKGIQEFFPSGKPQPLFNTLSWCGKPEHLYDGYSQHMWQPQHLYFISTDPDEEIKEGDIAVYNGELYHINTHHKGVKYKGKNATSGGGRTEYNYYTVLNMSKRTSSTEIIHYPYSRRFKPVVACSDPSLGLLAIPLTWIRDVYVPSNGSIKEVKLEMEGYYYEGIGELTGPLAEYKLKLTPDNEVVIVDEPIISEYIMQRIKDIKIKFQQKLDAKTDSLKVDQELEDAAKDHARYGGPFSTHKQNYEYMFKQGANWKAQQSANDAIEFANWKDTNTQASSRVFGYFYWVGDNYSVMRDNKELYELWQTTLKR